MAYQTIQELHEENNYPVLPMCKLLHVTRSAYYRWLKHPQSKRVVANQALAKVIRTIHEDHPEKGYRGNKDQLNRTYAIQVNDKRVLRICRHEGIQSTIKHPANCNTRRANRPYHTAENVLNRDFTATKPNQKWVTDMTEFKYVDDSGIHKV